MRSRRVLWMGLLLTLASTLPAAGQSPIPSAAPPSLEPTGGIADCAVLPRLSPPEDALRETPIYVANEQPISALQAWARGRPGYETLWIDREHLGWVVLAFSQDPELRQEELERDLPGVGAAVVGVDWSYRGLRRLQQRVVRELPRSLGGFSVGVSVTQGVVTITLGVLYPERVAAIERLFGGLPVCLEGADPADVPAPGPQPRAGDGWRLLGHARTGAPYRTGIAYDQGSLDALWARARMPGEPPRVDLDSRVVIWFGAVYGSSCPGIRLDDVVVDAERSVVHALIVLPDPPAACTDDANGHAYLVALDRDRLPAPPFRIQLDDDGPPLGAQAEVSVVDADLRVPGSVAGPGEVHRAPRVRPRNVVTPGGFVEPGFASRFLMDARCGIAWLGPLNDVWWHADGDPAVPVAWQPGVQADGTVEVTILVVTGDDPTAVDGQPRLDATLDGVTVTYRPSPLPAPACDITPA